MKRGNRYARLLFSSLCAACSPRPTRSILAIVALMAKSPLEKITYVVFWTKLTTDRPKRVVRIFDVGGYPMKNDLSQQRTWKNSETGGAITVLSNMELQQEQKNNVKCERCCQTSENTITLQLHTHTFLESRRALVNSNLANQLLEYLHTSRASPSAEHFHRSAFLRNCLKPL